MSRPFIPFVHGARVVLDYTLGGSSYVFTNVLHCWSEEGFDHDLLVDLSNIFRFWDLDKWKYLRASYFFMYQITCTALDTPSSPTYTLPLGNTHPGTRSNNVWTFAATKAIALHTNVRGRNAQGTLHTLPLPEDTTGSPPKTITPTYGGLLVDAVEELIPRLREMPTPCPLVVASYRKSHLWRSEASYAGVDHAQVHNLRIDTLRKRLNQVPG